jgi:hypothetical protein
VGTPRIELEPLTQKERMLPLHQIPKISILNKYFFQIKFPKKFPKKIKVSNKNEQRKQELSKYKRRNTIIRDYR